MKVVFDDKALQEIYEQGYTKDKKYVKYCRDRKFIEKLVRQIDIIVASLTYESLLATPILHYERLKHNYAGYSSFRINSVERVICREHKDYIELTIIKLDDTHYGNKK